MVILLIVNRLFDAVSRTFLAVVSVKKVAAGIIQTCGRECSNLDDVQLLP